MHSSRMRTACLLTVSQHALPGRGVPAERVNLPGVYLSRGVYRPGGYLPGGVYLPGDVHAWGVYLPGDVPARGCTCPGGVPTWGGIPTQVLTLVNLMTDRPV